MYHLGCNAPLQYDSVCYRLRAAASNYGKLERLAERRTWYISCMRLVSNCEALMACATRYGTGRLANKPTLPKILVLSYEDD